MQVLQALVHMTGLNFQLDLTVCILSIPNEASADLIPANGSGRKPASYNGCSAIRPSTGIVNTDGVVGQFPWVIPKSHLEVDTDLAWPFQAIRHARVLREGSLEIFRLHIGLVWKLANASLSF